MPDFTILVVDNYEPFRRVAHSILKQKKNVEVIGEASDGLEAVQKAKELGPDLILLEVALPKLNGILAAKRLRDILPRAKILFFSIESASCIVRETFNVGGIGYVHKLDASNDLLSAIETVLHGEQFVSRTVKRESTVGSGAPRLPQRIARRSCAQKREQS